MNMKKCLIALVLLMSVAASAKDFNDVPSAWKWVGKNEVALMYNKDTEKWENTDLEKPVGESVNKYLNEAVIDGGSAPTP